MGREKKEKEKSSFGVVRILILLIALGVFGYSGYNLLSLYIEYKKSAEEYTGLADQFTRRYEPGSESGGAGIAFDPVDEKAESGVAFNPLDEEGVIAYEDADPPITVDWDELAKINPEIVGWIYVDACPTINYPICRGADNDYYLHHTFRGEYRFSGSIFEDFHNSPDFSDPNSVVYGHNMKDGSMFNTLKKLKDQSVYDSDPYFWILTPKGNYRYHIFAVMTTAVNSDVYLLYPYNTPEFLKWEEKVQAMSEVKNSVKLSEDDHSVILSTCVSNDSYRMVVIGKCVSSDHPAKVTPTPTPTPRPTPIPTLTPEPSLDDIFIDPDFVEYFD